MYSFHYQFKFNDIFRFLCLRVISCFLLFIDKKKKEFSLVLLSLGWNPLSGEFVASYPLVDSLGSEVYLLFSYLLGGFL